MVPWSTADLEEAALRELVRKVKLESYGPRDLLNHQRTLIVVRSGLLTLRNKFMRRNGVIGAWDVLLTDPQLLDTAIARTVSHVEVAVLLLAGKGANGF